MSASLASMATGAGVLRILEASCFVYIGIMENEMITTIV